MKLIDDFNISAKITATRHTTLYRGWTDKGTEPVIIAHLKIPDTTGLDLDLIQAVQAPQAPMRLKGMLIPHDYRGVDDGIALICEDFAGIPLTQCLPPKPRTQWFLETSLQLARILMNLHHKNIIHKGIQPSHIFIHPRTHEVKLGYFDCPPKKASQGSSSPIKSDWHGELEYIAPEQTGRLDHAVDCRSDLYALGTVFYEMLAGKSPFGALDPEAIIHAHIAVQPVPPARIDPAIPQPLSDIVMKLLAKNPADRYQSAQGVALDLLDCRNQWEKSTQIINFPLAQKDLPASLGTNQKRVGRKKEKALLRKAFTRVCHGDKGVALVAGEPGVGKSALIQELADSVFSAQSLFIQGKYEKDRQNLPYGAILQAFRSLINRISTDTEEKKQAWKQDVLKTIGDNGQIIVDVIPELMSIIGQQPTVPRLGPAETQNRFHLVLRNFVAGLTRKERPLVLFLDDLQWADQGSLDLLNTLMNHADLHYFLLIGAFRENEVLAPHPLTEWIQKMRDASIFRHQIALSPLTLQEIQDLLSSCFFCEAHQTRMLAELLQQKTNGNPFFLNQFLNSLMQSNQIQVDPVSGWAWDFEGIRNCDLADNVVHLLVAKIAGLDQNCTTTLKTCACIGSRFDAATPSRVMGQPVEAVLQDLSILVEEGLLRPIKRQFEFVHDKVQEAAYALLPETEKKHLHYKIGRCMLPQNPSETLGTALFYRVNHLNLGIDWVATPEEQYRLARINYLAGQKAKQAAAHQSAFHYFRTGIQLIKALPHDFGRTVMDRTPLPTDADSSAMEGPLTLNLLYRAASEAAFLMTDYPHAKALAERLISTSRLSQDKARGYEIKIRTLIAQNQFQEAIQLGRRTLKKMGIHIPAHPKKYQIIARLGKTLYLIKGKDLDTLVQRPVLDDPLLFAQIRILDILALAAYRASPALLPVISLEGIDIIIAHGNCQQSPWIFAGYALILCRLGDIGNGFRFGQTALRLSEKLEAAEYAGRTTILVNMHINHLKLPLKNTFDPLKNGHQQALATGDFEHAAYALFGYFNHLYLSGHPLTQCDLEAGKISRAIQSLNQHMFLCLHQINHQTLYNLRGRSKDPLRLAGPFYDEDLMLPTHQKAGDMTAICNVHISKHYLFFLFEHYDQAYAQGVLAEKQIDSQLGNFFTIVFLFHFSLTCLALSPTASPRHRKKLWKKVKANQSKMKRWSRHAPMNHQHRYHLVAAEMARVSGYQKTASKLYQKAIIAARENGFIQDKALADEITAKFYLNQNLTGEAGMYMTRAYQGYLRWGAKAKAEQLQGAYAELLRPSAAAMDRTAQDSISLKRPSTDPYSISKSLDLSSMIRASQAISSEIVLDKLLTKLMQLTIENAGAEKGFLILKNKGALRIEAEGTSQSERFNVLHSVPIEAHPSVSPTIIHSVAKNQTSVILDDAANEGDFVEDAAIIRQRAKSILCLPIINQNVLMGMLYLVNNLTTGAFTRDHIAVIEFMASQIAISLDNARLYADLAQKNERLQRLDKLKDSFLATTSHELRTPLNGIIGISQSLIDGVRGSMPAKAQRDLTLIAQCGNRLVQLLDDIQDFSRLKSQDITLAKTAVDIKSLTNVVIDLLAPLNTPPKLKMVNAIPPDVVLVDADENRLHQILLNLIGNAVKFTEKGEVVISAAVLEPPPASSAPPSGRLKITVTDTGIGIPLNHQKRIFEPYEQGDGTDSRNYGGMGIGLAIVKYLVHLHGGEIEVASTLGQGACFAFTLPLAKTEALPSQNIRKIAEQKLRNLSFLHPRPDADYLDQNRWPIFQPQPSQTFESQEKILLVDDDPVNIEVITNFFHDEPYTVIPATNGIEALQSIEETPFDLVLLDVMMPKMSGYEVCRSLRAHYSIHELPIIILTAKNRVADLVVGFECGANDYLTKPVTKEELITRTKTLITLKKTVRQHKEAKYKLLQERMNPHFLFNALNSIHAYIHFDVEAADQAILKLAQSYRFLTDQSFKEMIPFETEWQFLTNYMELEKLQYSDTLQIRLVKEGHFEDVQIPPLTLQPLVENAFKHGLKHIEDEGRIHVLAQRQGPHILISVVDNGKGLDKTIDRSRSLENIQKRLKYHFEHASISIENNAYRGVKVWLEFDLKTAEPGP